MNRWKPSIATRKVSRSVGGRLSNKGVRGIALTDGGLDACGTLVRRGVPTARLFGGLTGGEAVTAGGFGTAVVVTGTGAGLDS